MSEKIYGYTKLGKPIDNEMIEQFVEEAERGYDAGQLLERRRGRGRPPLGDAAKTVGSIRLDPALRKEAASRATAEGVSISELLRRALREYLRARTGDNNLQHADEPPLKNRIREFDLRLVSEIEDGFHSATGECLELLNYFAEVLHDLSSEFKKLKDIDRGTQREKVEKLFDKVQQSSTSQMGRVKAIVEESENALSRLLKVILTKSTTKL